jgi:hypothetical protein
MIDFTTVSREIQGLIGRRRELLTLLGSVFAGVGLFLQNALQGNLPPSLVPLEEHLFACSAALLMVASLILSLRMMRLHAGMVYNGVLYAQLTLAAGHLPRTITPEKAASHNFAGASFLQIVQALVMAGFSTATLALALGLHPWLAATIGASVAMAALVLHFAFHHRAARAAIDLTRKRATGPVERDAWESHIVASLEATNNDLLGVLAFVGLMLFSALETLSALGSLRLHDRPDLAPDQVTTLGPIVYTSLMVLVAVFQAIIYVRLQVAQGRFSLDLDATDRPFRILTLTDSFLGYVLLACLLAVSVHLWMATVWPGFGRNWPLLLRTDAAVLLAAIVAQQAALAHAGRRYGRTVAVAPTPLGFVSAAVPRADLETLPAHNLTDAISMATTEIDPTSTAPAAPAARPTSPPAG